MMRAMATTSWLLPASDLDRLIDALRRDADELIGPTVVDGVIRMRPIERADDLPIDVTDDQDGGTYRVLRGTGASERRFSYAVGPDSIKAIVHPPRVPVATMQRSADGAVAVTLRPRERTRRAVIGVRACDLAARARLDRTQLDGPYPDPSYASARDGLFLVAVDCSHPAATCFCESMGTGPAVDGGADLALTELSGDHADDDADDGSVRYLVRAFSDAGRLLVEALELEPAGPDAVAHGDAVRRGARAGGRSMAEDAAATVLADLSHPRWDDVASRCLTCGNCTAVCPTCFCTATDERVELDGVAGRRDRVWDSCFSAAYSHLGPGSVRSSPMSRYRQWLTHKLGTWHDQFGESGCVGCGRCITWCPVGIDLTAEVEALAAGAGT
jgi:sulfhydrogenase subunit beta (sulfur reductase)